MSKKGVCMFFSGLFAGAALGTAAGMLFAPEAGEKLRRRINDSLADAYYDAYDKFVEFSDNMSEKFNELQANVIEEIETLKSDVVPVEEETFNEEVEAAQVEAEVIPEEPEAAAEAEAAEETAEA